MPQLINANFLVMVKSSFDSLLIFLYRPAYENSALTKNKESKYFHIVHIDKILILV